MMNAPRVQIRPNQIAVRGVPMDCEIIYVDDVPVSVHWLDATAMRRLQVEHIADTGEPAIHSTPCSGTISIQDIRNEFYAGGGPANLGELGANVIGRPWGQQIALSEFYCRSNIISQAAWITDAYTDSGNWGSRDNVEGANNGSYATVPANNQWIDIRFDGIQRSTIVGIRIESFFSQPSGTRGQEIEIGAWWPALSAFNTSGLTNDYFGGLSIGFSGGQVFARWHQKTGTYPTSLDAMRCTFDLL